MRKHLTFAIELISVLTAVGLVASVFIYSIAFGFHGIGYIGVASFADMIRDSIQFLVIMLSFLLSMMIMVFALKFHVDKALKCEFLTKTSIVLRSLIFSFATSVLISFYIVVLRAINITSSKEIFTVKTAYFATAIFVMLFTSSVFTLNNIRGRQSKITYFSVQIVNPIFIGFTAIMTIASGGFSVNNQIKEGLAANVEPFDKLLCEGSLYNVVWFGDSKFIVRCLKTNSLVVRVTD